MDKTEIIAVPARTATAPTISTTTSVASEAAPTAGTDQPRIVAGHDFDACNGCQRILGIDDLEVVLGETRNTLYKRSQTGRDRFPHRIPNRRKIAVLCQSAKTFLAAGAPR